MKFFQYFLVLCASGGLVYPKLTDSAVITVPSNAAKQAAAATKIQALARGHQVRKQQLELKQNAAALKIQKAFRAHQDRKKKEAAAQIIQKAGLGFFDRKFLKLESTLKNMPYLQFRDLICSGDYINKTDWLYRYIETKENKQMFTRGKDGQIDLKLVEPIKAEIDFDTLFHKYISLFHDFCYRIFVGRAVDEIVERNMPWSQAVSILQDGQPRFPVVYDNNMSEEFGGRVFLVLGQIFNDLFVKFLPDVAQTFPIEIDQDIYGSQAVMLKALGFDLYVPIEDFDDKEKFKEEKEYALQYFLEKYCESLGDEALPEVDIDNPAFGLDLLDLYEGGFKRKQYQYKLSDTERQEFFKMQTDKYEQDDWDKKNWVLAAQQTFQLGRLLFENQLDAFAKLGGQAWLDKQPKEVITIVGDHLKKLRKPTWKQKFLRWYGLGDNSLKDVQAQLYQG